MDFLHESTIISTDSQSTLVQCKNPIYHERSKHIEVMYHFIQEKIVCSDLILEKIHINVNLSDMGTKILFIDELKAYLSLLNIDIG